MSKSHASQSVADVLIALLLDRRFVDVSTVEETREDGSWSDAGSFLAGLVDGGHLTESQAARVEALLLTRLQTDAENLSAAVLESGLLEETELTPARHAWEEEQFSCTFGEHLVSAGLLTPHQATAALERVGRTQSTTSTEATAVEDPRSERLVRLGELAASSWQMGRDWWSKLSTRGRIVAGVAGFWLVLILLFGTAAIASAFRAPPIEPECNMDGYGRGTCVFTNGGGRTSRSCGTIMATCEGAELGVKFSPTFCSGDVEAGESVSVAFQVPEFDRMTPNWGDWRDSCGFIWLGGDD